MIGNLFWAAATSNLVLVALAVLVIAAFLVAHVPSLVERLIPQVAPYVMVAGLVEVLAAALLFFLLGVRVADERATLANLRAALAIKQADLAIASKSAEDAQARAAQIEKTANDQRKADDDYIASLKSRPACLLDDSDIRDLGRMRNRPSVWRRPFSTGSAR